MRLFPRKRRSSWELIDRKSVAPVFMLDYTDDYDDVEILNFRKHPVCGRYVFDITPKKEDKMDQFVRNALVFSRLKLVEQTIKYGWNNFLNEGWEITTYRKGVKWRIEVVYSARPALFSESKATRSSHLPPFLELLGSDVY